MDPTLKSERYIKAFARSKRVPLIKQSLLKTPPVKVSRRNTIKMVRFSRKQSPPSMYSSLRQLVAIKIKSGKFMAALRQEFRRTEGGRSLSRAATSRKIGSLIFSSSYCSKTAQIVNIRCTMISKKVKLVPNSLNTLRFCSLNPVQSTHSRETVQMARASIESPAFREGYISTLLLSSF